MRMSEGVESAVHVLLVMAWLDDREPVSTARLAASYQLSPGYLNKQLQALVRAGILTSVPGARGGFLLARRPADISLMDVVAAIEGSVEAFRCAEIRLRAAHTPPEASQVPCAVATSMRRAELAWRRALAAQSIADVRDEADAHAPGLAGSIRESYRH
jgi:Rrf2 family protein